MIQGSSGAYAKLFPEGQIPLILSSIIRVGENLHKQTATDHEDWITMKLHRLLIREPLFRDGPIQVDLQPEIVFTSVDLEKRTPEGRLDLKVSSGFGYEVYFAIEAKRLRVSLPSGLFNGGREYVIDGMMRFVTGQYAPLMQTGAMLGYVYDGEIQKARADVDKHVKKMEISLKLKGQKSLFPSPILQERPIDETNHDLGKRQFTIFHLFLGV
jgi:hypothetical protein